MIPSSRPEYLSAHEYDPITTYSGPLGPLNTRICSKPLGYHQDQGVIYRQVERNELVVGELSLGYDYGEKKISIEYISLAKIYRGKRIGSALFRAALELPLPDGNLPREEGFVLEAKYLSDDADMVWRSFVQRGLAEKVSDSDPYYIMR